MGVTAFVEVGPEGALGAGPPIEKNASVVAFCAPGELDASGRFRHEVCLERPPPLKV